MKTKVYTFEDSLKQSVWYRGGVVIYNGKSTAEIACKNVYPNRLKAQESAQRLMRKIRQEKTLSI